MKPQKLMPRFILVLIVLLVAAYYLYPSFRYETLRKEEDRYAQTIAEKMNTSYAYIIENISRDEAILRDKLAGLTRLSPNEKIKIEEQLNYLQGELQEKLIKYRKKAIKRGLDLQGGMHLVLEVDIVQLMQNLARQRDARLDRMLAEIDRRLSADVQAEFDDVVSYVFNSEDVRLSQYFGEAGETNSKILAYLNKEAEDAIDRSLEILRNRIDQFGVSEPSIQKKGTRRIVLELPGVQDPSRARDLIGRTALLEFILLTEPERATEFIQAVDKYLVEKRKNSDTVSSYEQQSIDTQSIASKSTGDNTKSATSHEDVFDISAEVSPGDTDIVKLDTSATQITDETMPFTSLLRNYQGNIAVPGENLRQVRAILADPTVNRLIPEGTKILWSAKPEIGPDQKEYHLIYFLKKDAELTGSSLSDARVDISSGAADPSRVGQSIVSLTMNRKGARTFSRVTGANIDKRLAIVLDEKVYMAPAIRSKIPNGRAIIEGLANIEEANDLAIVLRAGALPTSVVVEEERTVGPSLGRDSIRKGTSSAIIGLVIVMIFMMIYYGMSGIIANVALLLNIILIFVGLSLFGAMGMGATLSLPGIAGIILTIGMAVDANVLIFERIREELATGKTVMHAVAAGYDRAFTTILDANVTTLIAAFVLLQFGTGPIKGFAVTLSIGIACSLFTAIVVTRLIFDYITSRQSLTRLSI